LTESIRLRLPAVVTVQTSGRLPRYPSLSNTLRSRKQTIDRFIPHFPASLPPAMETVAMTDPLSENACEVLEGSPVEKADALLRLFNRKGWLR